MRSANISKFKLNSLEVNVVIDLTSTSLAVKENKLQERQTKA